MNAEPGDIDREQIAETIRSDWGIGVSSLRYEPVGFGTHHYLARDDRGDRWFVNVDELDQKTWIAEDADGALDGLGRSLRVAVELRRAGLEFVHAPVERRDGLVVARLGDRFALSVFAHVDGRSGPFGDYASERERRAVLNALGRMHASSIPPDLPRRDRLEIPLRESFDAALHDLGSAWMGGPYAEPARALLTGAAGATRHLFARYDELAAGIDRDGWVITHGEPHAANVIRAPDDSFVLIDWDTALLGPRERDLWMVEPKDDADLDAYTSGGGSADIDPGTLEFYRLWWTLAEITGYTRTFRSAHEDDADTQAAWAAFKTYVPEP